MESSPEQAVEGLAIVRVLAAVLDRLVCANENIARADPGQVTKFHAMKAPGIAIQQYLERIHKYASCSNECFILALIYIDRLIQRNNFLLTELNVHRVVITAILLAAKFFDDAYYNNAYYAKVGGVLVSEVNGLEVDFLFRINFTLHVTPEEFDKYRVELLSHSSSTTELLMDTTPATPSPAQVSPEVTSSAPSIATMDSDDDAMIVSSTDVAAIAAMASQLTAGSAQQQPSSVHMIHDPVHTAAEAAAAMAPADGYVTDETGMLVVQRPKSFPRTAPPPTAEHQQHRAISSAPGPHQVAQPLTMPKLPPAGLNYHHHHTNRTVVGPLCPPPATLIHHNHSYGATTATHTQNHQGGSASAYGGDHLSQGPRLTGMSGAGL